MTAAERAEEFCRLVDAGMPIYVARRVAAIGSHKSYQLRPSKEVRRARGQRDWHWTADEERLLLAAGKGELTALAKKIGRTYFAAYRHRERLLKCSHASGKAKG